MPPPLGGSSAAAIANPPLGGLFIGVKRLVLGGQLCCFLLFPPLGGPFRCCPRYPLFSGLKDRVVQGEDTGAIAKNGKTRLKTWTYVDFLLYLRELLCVTAGVRMRPGGVFSGLDR